MLKSKYLILLVVFGLICFTAFYYVNQEQPTPQINTGARTDNVWELRLSSYLATVGSGYNVLINGVNRYLNFGTTSGTSGYGFRDNGGSIEVKSSGGSWATIPSFASAGTVTSVGMTVPTGLTVSGVPITSAGTSTITLTSGYHIPLIASSSANDAKVSSQWITNSSDIYYLTGKVGIGVNNPSTALDVNGQITSSNVINALGGNSTNWNTAYGWGDHASAGYAKYAFGANNFSGTGSFITTGTSSLGNIEIPGVYNTIQDPTGFPDYTASTITFASSTRTFTIAPTSGSYDYYINGVKYSTTTAASLVIPTTAGQLNYIYIDNVTKAFTQSSTPWDLNDVQIATVYWNGTDGLIGFDRHGVNMDWATHKYLHLTVGARYEDGLAGTFTNNNTFAMTMGTIHDEDNIDDIPATTTSRILYRTAANGFTFDTASTSYFRKNCATNHLCYDNGTVPTSAGSNNYVNYWVFATNDRTQTIYVIMGQTANGSITTARAEQPSSLVLGTLPFPEMKLLYKVLLRDNATTYIETTDYRNVSTLASNNFTASAHSSLTGLDYASSGHTGFAGLDVDNTYTGLNVFGNASSTLLSVSGNSWFTGTINAINASSTRQTISGSLGLGGASFPTVDKLRILSTSLGSGLVISNSDADGAGIRMSYDGGTGKFFLDNLYNNDNGSFIFRTKGNTLIPLSINGSGNVLIPNASTTLLSVSGQSWFTGLLTSAQAIFSKIWITISATLFTNTAGEIGIDSTTGQLRYNTGSATSTLINYQNVGFTYATSSPWSATTTIQLGTAFENETWSSVICYTDVGTLNYQFYSIKSGTTKILMNLLNASTATTTQTLSTNNAVSAGSKRGIDIGTPATAPTTISCSAKKSVDPN